MTLPNLLPSRADEGKTCASGIVFAVYAPFASDLALSTFPDGQAGTVAEHALTKQLTQVAACGVGVVALIDLAGEDTALLRIAPYGVPSIEQSGGKLDMTAPKTLSGLLEHARALLPQARVVLALEGHGAGYLPDLDHNLISLEAATTGGITWILAPEGLTPLRADGSPLIEQGAPILPVSFPTIGNSFSVMSTWGVGAALAGAGQGERDTSSLALVHFNNCFNMSAELLHTVSRHAEYAVGYCNYNFFTAGSWYPKAFSQLQAAGQATPEQLARWFAEANRDFLNAKGNHPTVGGVIDLSRMHEITERLDDLADALLAALRTSPSRADEVAKIKKAIVAAQQYDTQAGYVLEAPDQLTDLCSFAARLQEHDFGPYGVKAAAAALQGALKGVKAYGATDAPWVDPNVQWNFSEETLAMNILLPDPLLEGVWDWRSPYYLDVNPDPNKPLVQQHIIDFLKVTDWVDFIIEYHKGVPFKGLLPSAIPPFPVFNERYDPKRDDCGCDGGKVGGRRSYGRARRAPQAD